MDQNLKKKIVLVKSFIQSKQYQNALDQLQVLMYKYQKVYQVHLMLGLCYQKMTKPIQAQKSYLQVLDLKDDQPNAIKALCQIYTKKQDTKNATLYLQRNVQVLKGLDQKKYRQAVVKLVEIYKKQEIQQKIYNIFMEYVQKEDIIAEDFVQIANAYFHVSVNSKSFNLQQFQLMGLKGQVPRLIQISAREKLNILLIDIVNYLMAVSKQYHLTQKDIANSLYEMKCYFPYAPCMLMLLLLDEYCVGQVPFSTIILQEIFRLLQAYYEKKDNGYLNLEFTQPEIFTVSMVLGYQYLAFFRQFFTLDPCFDPYFQNLALKQEELLSCYKVRQQYSKKINNFILKKCRYLHKISQTKNVQNQLEDMKKRIQLLDGSFLEQVIAKMAMNCFVNYQKLDDMKNMLKIRIKNIPQGDKVPHLYKYYVDYLLKIAKIYKVLDEQISIYSAVQYINLHDPSDRKFMIQNSWLCFSRSMLLQSAEQKQSITLNEISVLQSLLPQLKGQLKSQCLRKLCVMQCFSGNFLIQALLKSAISLDRSFANLQCMGFYLFFMKSYEQALIYLKQAFILNQNHYHTNRLIFVLLYKLDRKAQAVDFVDRIKEGFRQAFWINYVLALKYINAKKYNQAEAYLNAAIQCFTAGIDKKFKFSYEKTIEHQKFAYLYMVQQNEFSILFDQVIFPQQTIYNELPMVSSLFYSRSTKRTQIQLFHKIGQILKVLGRTKSSLNYLNEAYSLSLTLSLQQVVMRNQKLQLCLLYKQYSTLLFYMQMFRQCQQIAYSSYSICQQIITKQDDKQRLSLLQQLQSEINSLLFQVSVERLSNMMKFQSYQTVDQYLNNIHIIQPRCPSVNFMKGKYQFYILEYLHKRQSIQQISIAANNYLRHFGLSHDNMNSIQFENKYFSLQAQQKVMVRQAIEDFMIVKYMSCVSSIKQSQLINLVQIFPVSRTFYILFGMITPNVSLKTSCFLKCIQLDKQSTISIDLLGSLYLKQKNYLSAIKLFLKSLEIDVLNNKSYLGLMICLFCIIGKNMQNMDNDVVQIVHKAIVRINSYIHYIRMVDPSDNFHLLNFFRLLVTDQPISTFHVKTVLQATKKHSKYKYKNTLIYQLLEQATSQWKDHNIWQQQGQVNIMQEFIYKFCKKKCSESNANCSQIANAILNQSNQQFQELLSKTAGKYQFLMKEIQKLLHQICISVNMASKDKFNKQYFEMLISLLKKLQAKYERAISYSQECTLLIKKLKQYLNEYVLIKKQYVNHKVQISSVFMQIQSYSHFSSHPQLIPKMQSQLYRCILLNPSNQQLKKIVSNHMVINGAKKLIKGKYDYKVQLVNNTHQSLWARKETYKKLILLYRDQSSWLQYIAINWQEDTNKRTKHNLNTYLRLLHNIYQSLLNNNNQTNTKDQISKVNTKDQTSNLEKAQALIIQIYSYYVAQNRQKLKFIQQVLSKQSLCKVQIVVQLNKFYQQSNPDNLKSVVCLLNKQSNLLSESNNIHILVQLLSYLTSKFLYQPKLQQMLNKLYQSASSMILKSHLQLLRFLYIVHRPIKTQQQLIKQILDLQYIIIDCQQLQIDTNTISIMKCQKCLISADYDQLAKELQIAAKKSVATYSDQILINFYQIMRLYKEVETNPNKDGVIQNFAIYVDQMILLVKDPFYQGFFYSLKALVNSIIVPEESFVKDRNLRLSLMMSPVASSVFVKNLVH